MCWDGAGALDRADLGKHPQPCTGRAGIAQQGVEACPGAIISGSLSALGRWTKAAGVSGYKQQRGFISARVHSPDQVSHGLDGFRVCAEAASPFAYLHGRISVRSETP